MNTEALLLCCVMGVVAGLPAAALASMPSLGKHPKWKRVLVLVGAFVWLLPIAFAPALIIVFYVFGIDMLD